MAGDRSRIVLCPRCQRDFYTAFGEAWTPGDPLPPAVSKMDDKTEICSACGDDEGDRDERGLPPIPPNEWPV